MKPRALNEVTEAVLCLKGIPSPPNFYSNPSHAAALDLWRNKLYPNLSKCLDRTAQLINSTIPSEDGLIILAQELATKYNLSLENNNIFNGFVDLSDQKSGFVIYTISGFSVECGILDPCITQGKQCGFAHWDPVTKQVNFTECLEKLATTLPAFFLGKH
ncbi:hypothetical protein THRCLA_08542 [Thraustotheca clavata]|uniref:Uncharacterized protein n=1 Tax=Thraustotheca clavata TaxID=74557 RepID=A0A1V9Z5F2_9STRA|nr:hypothetical protein THRCLA_08542 [Thraustotheca clavata]